MSESEKLPYADRPIATAPGHWVLARAGKKVLRPGGAALSTQMLKRAGIPGVDVVELAPGMGRTAALVVRVGPASYTGVDREPQAVRQVIKRIGSAGRVVVGDAAATGLDSHSADLVIAEAMLSMQGDRGKAEIIAEAARLLRPGGRYAIHELAVTPDDIPEEEHTRIRQELARAIHVNARPLTPSQWRRALEDAGLEVEWCQTAPMALLSPTRVIRDEGFAGFVQIVRNLARDGALRARVWQMASTFRANRHNMCGIAIIARKPLGV